MQDFLAKPSPNKSSKKQPSEPSQTLDTSSVSKLLQKAVMEAARSEAFPHANEIELEKLSFALRTKSKGSTMEVSSGVCLAIASAVLKEQLKLGTPVGSDSTLLLALQVAQDLARRLSQTGGILPSPTTVSETGHLVWQLQLPKKAGTPFVRGHRPAAEPEQLPLQNQLVVRIQHAFLLALCVLSPFSIRQTSFHVPAFDQEVFELYCRYQAATHDDHDKTEQGYTSFLVDTPLKPQKAPEGSFLPGYGTWHMHYRLNGTLVAVAVLDILPDSIISVYFFWDRSLEHLNFGTYSALNELEFARVAGIKFYYLGWYVHTSKKMNYKSSFYPTEILCPDSLVYVPLNDEVREKLDRDGYATLSPQVRSLYFFALSSAAARSSR